jgi:hypothetical protein
MELRNHVSELTHDLLKTSVCSGFFRETQGFAQILERLLVTTELACSLASLMVELVVCIFGRSCMARAFNASVIFGSNCPGWSRIAMISSIFRGGVKPDASLKETETCFASSTDILCVQLTATIEMKKTSAVQVMELLPHAGQDFLL